MTSRSIRHLPLAAAAGLIAAACGNAAGNAPAAKQTATAAVDSQQQMSRVDALRADAEVAAARGDLLSARRYLGEALDSEPGNALMRERLVQLGGTPPAAPAAAPALAAPLSAPVPAPVLAAAPPASAPASPPASAPVQASTTAAPAAPTVVAAAPAAARTARAHGPRRTAGGRAGVVAAGVVAGGEVAASPRATDVRAAGSSPVESSAAAPTAVGAAAAVPTDVVERARVADLADARVAAPRAVAALPPAKHKRTWPWTRAQRWLVAKGVVGGGGAGVVVGALIGNVPGALIAGSLGGGAVGFKKATKIGPADPYPSEQKTAEFNGRRRGSPRSDTTAAAGRGGMQTVSVEVGSRP